MAQDVGTEEDNALVTRSPGRDTITMLADYASSQLLVHSQLCEDERVAFGLQLQILGCDYTVDVVDGLLVDIAAAHNEQAALCFAQDAAMAEQEATQSQALRLVAISDSDMARKSHEVELKKEARTT